MSELQRPHIFMNRTADQRINITDLFRVAAGIGRRDEVRAIR
ncbi:hypothetical protein [Halomonas mongoliensis]